MLVEMTYINILITSFEPCFHGDFELNVEEISTSNKVQNAK
jgi:hypothetical protein